MQKNFVRPTTRKIDFFGGLHGNFLELAINHAIDKNPYDISSSQFLYNGACHVKNDNDVYKPITIASHFSFYNSRFDNNDLVIRIVPQEQDMLIAVTNSFVRAGNQALDLENLEHMTYQKMSNLPKLGLFLENLLLHHGKQEAYSRSILRHYFYSMFADPKYGLDTFQSWKPAQKVFNFKFDTFFRLDLFFESLQGIANFVNIDFVPSVDLVNLHKEFLQKNQGWHSHIKCNIIIDAVIKQISMPLNLNIVEEAWIAWRIAKIFNVYQLKSCTADNFAKDTLTIIEEINEHYQGKLIC